MAEPRHARMTPVGGPGRAVLLLGLMLISAGPARSELLYFQKGGQVQAAATIDGDRVLVSLPEGVHEFHRADFRQIVAGFSPDRDWPGRRESARGAGTQARYDAAWWAIQNGLVTSAVAELRELHSADPGHAPTARMTATLDRLARPCLDPDKSAFKKALAADMNTAVGPHVLLLHQHSDAEAEGRIALLEQVITGYYLFFAGQGMELQVPERRMIFAWFSEQSDYLAFLRAQNAAPFLTTRGYYHPTWNAVVAYDARSSDRQRSGRESLHARREELRRFRETLDGLPARARLRVVLTGEPPRTLGRAEAAALIDRLDGEVHREDLLQDMERQAIDGGTAAHEMVHLLAANSGLLPDHNAFPIWLQEGLAMQFEVVRGGRWAGISRAHDLRLPDWRRIQPSPRLEPLISDVGFGRGYQRDPYAQAWALVYYLGLKHPEPFLKYLDVLRSRDASLSDLAPTDRYRTAFQRAFGSNLDALEHDWHQFLGTVQTPLELHAPESGVRP